MEEVERVLESLNGLCNSISEFKQDRLEQAIYHSPVIDHYHPDDYSQRAVTGLSKFMGHAETERDHVLSVSTILGHLSMEADPSCSIRGFRPRIYPPMPQTC
jgi:hypothetical protein